MAGDLQAVPSKLPPHVQLIQMATGAWVARTVYAAAMLGLADQLTDGPKSAAELARPVRAHAPSLHRLMRTLASLGILAEQKEQRYVLTTLGAALKTNAPGSAKSTVLTLGSPWAESAWDHLVYSVQTGKTGFEKAQGMPLFDYFARHPEDASLFNETMVGFHGQEPPAVAAAYDFRPSKLSLMSAVGREIFWPPSSPVMLNRAACFSICRMWWPKHPRCLRQKASAIV